MDSSALAGQLGLNPPGVPETLLRAFSTEQYARDFIGGSVRIGLLAGYTRAEGSRQDETEGTVRVVWSLENGGRAYCDRTSQNYYILSASHPETDRPLLRGLFGNHLVRINDPMELRNRLDKVWQTHPLASGRSIIVPVVYDKGELLEATPGLLPPHSYSYAQKPRVPFWEEREYRYVLGCTANVLKIEELVGEGRALNEHLTLHLPDCADICSLT